MPIAVNDTSEEFVGVDGCKAGWVAVAMAPDGSLKGAVFAHVKSVVAAYPRVPILIDIPIGLPGEGKNRRACEVEARKVLGGRRSSVFSAPARDTLKARTYDQAKERNRRATGAAISKQCWGILPKVKELDDFLERNPGARLSEMHPEVCFWALNRGRTLVHPKRTWPGFKERLAILQGENAGVEGFVESFLHATRRKDVKRDDLLDALAGALTMSLGEIQMRAFPAKPEIDDRGLSMQMVYGAPTRRPGAPSQPREPERSISQPRHGRRTAKSKPSMSTKSPTTQVDYLNRNCQRVVGQTDRAGNDRYQRVYVLECQRRNKGMVCRYRYGANGSDIFQRKCPRCQDGEVGLALD